jgi:hypothetical protein
VSDAVREPQTPEPTLGALLRDVARAELPARFYQLLQLALPLAVQAWIAGWPRIAGWLVVISAYGIWALCEQRIEEDSEPEVGEPRPSPMWVRALRKWAGAIAVLMAAALVLEGFLHLLSIGFACGRCAG